MGWGRAGEEKARGINNLLKMRGLIESTGTKTRMKREEVI
jgi:hypothetical protein